MIPVELKEEKNKKKKKIDEKVPSRTLLSKISKMELLLFTRELRTILESGLNINTGLHLMAEQTQNKYFSAIIRKIHSRVSAGENLSSGMSEFPWLFDRIYIGSIRAGEVNGNMEKSLLNLENLLTKEITIKRKIIQASIYPTIAFTVCLIFTYITFKFLLPNLIDFLTASGGTLPLPTRILIFLTNMTSSPWFIVLSVITVFILYVIFKQYVSLPNGKQTFHLFIMAVPGIGIIARKVAYMHITNSLSTLLQAGIPLVQAVEMAGESSANTVFEASCQQAAIYVKDGNPLSEFFANNHKLYGKIFASMIAVGEESGNLPEMAHKLSLLYEVDVDNALNSIGVLIEPVLIFFTGSIIGFVMLAIFLPLYSTISTLQ